MGCGVSLILSRRTPLSNCALLLFAALSAHAATYYVTITGLGGEPDYTQRFKMWAEDIDGSLKKSGGDVNVVTMQLPTRDQVRARFNEIAKQAKNTEIGRASCRERV